MDHLTRIPEICTVSEAANVLRLSFGNAQEVAEFRRLVCENAGDQTCATFWDDVSKHILKLDQEDATRTVVRETQVSVSL